MTKFFNKFKKPYFCPAFWPIFPILGHFVFFFQKIRLSRVTSDGFLNPCQNLEKTNDPIPRKCLDRLTCGLTGPSL